MWVGEWSPIILSVYLSIFLFVFVVKQGSIDIYSCTFYLGPVQYCRTYEGHKSYYVFLLHYTYLCLHTWQGTTNGEWDLGHQSLATFTLCLCLSVSPTFNTVCYWCTAQRNRELFSVSLLQLLRWSVFTMHGSTGTVAFVEEGIMNRFGPLCCNVFIIVSQRGTASSSTLPKPLFKAPGCRASGRATVS